jgi:hypothetical protein
MFKCNQFGVTQTIALGIPSNHPKIACDILPVVLDNISFTSVILVCQLQFNQSTEKSGFGRWKYFI